ncbi:MAG: hypothetical protein AB8G99_11220 [Planctomycetaceae bacterium]
MNRNGLRCSLILLFTVAFCCSSAIAEVRRGDQVTVAAEETIDDDLYVFATEVVVDGTINGDLIAFAKTVTINGTVTGDVLGAAQGIKIDGKVRDDVRVAAQTIILGDTAAVDDDLVTAGVSLDCQPASRIGGELNYAGYQARLAGTIERNTAAAVANCELAGAFGGDVQLTVASRESQPMLWHTQEPIEFVAAGLTVTDSTSIAGDLNYESNAEGIIDPAAQIAGVVNYGVLDREDATPPTIADRALSIAKYFAALLAVGLLMVFAFPNCSERTVAAMTARPLASLTWGLGSFIAIIAGGILFLVATIAIAVLLGLVSLDLLVPPWLGVGLLSTASLAVGYTIFSVWFAKALVGYWAGKALLSSETSGRRKFLALALGCALIVGISQIPLVGTAVSLLIAMVGTGASVISWRDARKAATEITPRLSVQQAA